MLCTFTNGTSTYRVDLPASCTWRTPVGGNAGEASVFVPFGNGAASSSFINPDGGSALSIDAGDAGIWRGIVTRVAFSDRGVAVTAHQPWILLSRRPVRKQVLQAVPAGYIAGIAISDGLSGLRGMYAGAATYESLGPSVYTYSMNRQTAWSVLSDMMNISDGELHVDADTGRVDWGGPFAYATRYDTLLTAGTDILNLSIERDTTTRLAAVTATYDTDYEVYTAVKADSAGGQNWPAESVITSNSGGTALISAADSALSSASLPVQTLTADLPASHWGVRERAYVRCLVPWDGFSGRMFSARVLERTISDPSPLMRVRMQIAGQDNDEPLLAIGGRARTGSTRTGSTLSWFVNLRERFGNDSSEAFR